MLKKIRAKMLNKIFSIFSSIEITLKDTFATKFKKINLYQNISLRFYNIL